LSQPGSLFPVFSTYVRKDLSISLHRLKCKYEVISIGKPYILFN
jgi:hypothetical protein